MNDQGSRTHLLKELKEKEKWRSTRLREFVFANKKTNTFLKELACHQNLLKDFSINDMDLLLKTEEIGDQDLFPESERELESKEAKLALKSRITTILTRAQAQSKDFFFLGLSKAAKAKIPGQQGQTLFDYFMEAQRKRFSNGDSEKAKNALKRQKEKETLKEPVRTEEKACLTSREEEKPEKTAGGQDRRSIMGQVMLPVLGASPLKRIKEKMHLFLNLPHTLQTKENNTSRSVEKKIGFLSDRRDLRRKPQTLDFGIDLSKKKARISEFAAEEEEQAEALEGLPLKYRSRGIYEKILAKNKRLRGFRDRSLEKPGFKSLSSLLPPAQTPRPRELN